MFLQSKQSLGGKGRGVVLRVLRALDSSTAPGKQVSKQAKTGVVVWVLYVYNLRTWEGQTRGSGFQGYPGLCSKFEAGTSTHRHLGFVGKNVPAIVSKVLDHPHSCQLRLLFCLLGTIRMEILTDFFFSTVGD